MAKSRTPRSFDDLWKVLFKSFYEWFLKRSLLSKSLITLLFAILLFILGWFGLFGERVANASSIVWSVVSGKKAGVWLDVTVLGRYYEMNVEGDIYSILPTDSAAKAHYGMLEFPSLDVKIVNNTSQTLFFTQAIFEVQGSSTDTRPIPSIRANACLGSLVEIRNEGWGKMKNVKLKLNIAPTTSEFLQEDTINFQGLLVTDSSIYRKPSMFVRSIAEIDTFCTVNLYHELDKMGFDTLIFYLENVIRSGNVDESLMEQIMNKLGQDSGSTESGEYDATREVYVYGALVYAATYRGRNYLDSLCFAFPVSLFNEDCGEGFLSSASYGVEFKLEATDYQIIVPVSQYIKANEVDRFTFKISTRRSSEHSFKLKLKYGEHEQLVSPKINLNIYAPRTFITGY